MREIQPENRHLHQMEKVISQGNQINESDFYENDEAVVLSILGDENSANPEHFYSHE